MRTYQLTALIAALGAFACTEEVESTDVRTSGIYPVILVTADGSGQSKVEVALKVGGASSNTYLDLKGGDELTATANGQTKVLDETGGNKHTATFDTEAADTEFVIAFNRGADDDGAPSSRVRLPAPFDLALEETEVSRSDGILNFTWDPPADEGQMAWSAAGDCIFDESDSTSDDGTAAIGAGTLEATNSQKEETCSVKLTLSRTRTGTADSEFSEGGDVKARQVRQKSFNSTP